MDIGQQLERNGYALVQQAIGAETLRQVAAEIENSLAQTSDESVALRNRAGVYGARNILDICPATRAVWRTPALLELLTHVLGNQFGLVRGLYFDKPPERSWALPWHQDLTIAVQDNRLASSVFTKPTRKADVPHVEAPPEILARMLTLRIHLDDVTDENGPLRVLPGTHRQIHEQPPVADPVTILADAGDVLAMRPMLFHASEASRLGTIQHRRILHLEFAADKQLPDGYEWHLFLHP